VWMSVTLTSTPSVYHNNGKMKIQALYMKLQ
jgi:hypothetical protein